MEYTSMIIDWEALMGFIAIIAIPVVAMIIVLAMFRKKRKNK